MRFDAERLFKPKFALVIITVIALAFRMVTIRFKYLLGYDPYFHLAYIRAALKAGEWFNFFTRAIGPWGLRMKLLHPLGLWMTPAYIYKFLGVFGVSLFNSFRITPVIFGVLTIIFLYLAILWLYGEKEAFFVSLFLAISFGHIFRSMAGYYRGDNYMLFWYSVALAGIALAFHMKERLGKKRFALYLVPALASGLSAAFWQAYYPIFVFLFANSILLTLGAFLLGEEDKLADSLGILLSTAAGVLLANKIGSSLGYGMTGETRWLGKSLAKELGLHFGVINDAFLLLYMKYAVPLGLALILLLLLLIHLRKDPKFRIAVTLILTVGGIAVAYHYYGVLNGALNRIFTHAPIAETQRTSWNDWWTAYGLSGLLIPLYVLCFRRDRVKSADFMLLGLIMVSIYMIVTWTRFLFIGSMGIAVMAGLGIWELYTLSKRLEAKKALAAGVIILLLLPIGAAFTSAQSLKGVKPLINDHWVEALTWLGNHSAENDVVMTWWDYGHWVTYYSQRAPVAQGSPNAWVAKYYLGYVNEKGLMNLGVDYVIVSYYDFAKFWTIVETAGIKRPDYFINVMYLTSSVGSLVFQGGSYTAIAKPGKVWDVQVIGNGAAFSPAQLYVEDRKGVEKVPLAQSTAKAYLYININYGYAVLMNENAFNTTLAKLFIHPGKDYETVYSDGGLIKILRFKHPNVEVLRANGTVVFHFENATGTTLTIYGFLDNGTLIFKKSYNVKDREEFVLPEEVEGVVIRYTYLKGRTVLDRGVFRRG